MRAIGSFNLWAQCAVNTAEFTFANCANDLVAIISELSRVEILAFWIVSNGGEDVVNGSLNRIVVLSLWDTQCFLIH